MGGTGHIEGPNQLGGISLIVAALTWALMSVMIKCVPGHYSQIVVTVILNDNKKRYLLLDEVGVPVIPVMKYLKHLGQTGKSNNTLKTYCYALKQYFTYLKERNIDYKEVGVKDLADFVG
ncbi:site-specific integrase [Paenibacillus sp. N5-1-1-5]|uniref:Site-specific integrase n=2 Tax=Paenibacillus radicis (ex Xue et al. 2023) TaxID=2972489 RepID=A0ABT1YHN8_9BACL|nr:site-specific integrase [Paenibacillus radicis (ex Xue et al. 2023)]MCR8632709.1 site-specific integrase [Paenibacillus radicis (ex Xue et al. 2023)]